jgi:single-strand DNA-binding protein
MSFEIEGTLHKVFEAENKSGKFVSREFVIQIQSGNYPEYPKFQLVQDRVNIIDGMNEGEKIKVYFDLRGREWQGKYFGNLNCWRVEKASGDAVPVAARAAAPPPVSSSLPPEPPAYTSAADNEDLPF